MAHLIAVRRRDDYKFTRRQLPLKIDDTFTMVIMLGERYLDTDLVHDDELVRNMDCFKKRFSLLSKDEIVDALSIEFRDVYDLLAQVTPCVGCRRSVERLYDQLVISQHEATDPLVIGPNGILSVNAEFIHDAQSIYALFSIHGNKVNELIDSIPKSKKNKRCNLHSLDTHKSKVNPVWLETWDIMSLECKDEVLLIDADILLETLISYLKKHRVWLETWDIMSLECKDEVLLIDADILLETLISYLKKHRFCVECKSKVQHAYNILVGDVDCTKDKTYCQALYEGLRCCPEERHVHIPCDTKFITHLINRAEPELAGSRRERHAKTLDIAQEEVLTCLGLSVYERLYRIGQKLRAEEQTWQLLFYLGIESIKKSFEVALEKKQGVSQLELMCEELEEEEKAREVRRQVKKRRKKKKREATKEATREATKQREVVCEVDYDAPDERTNSCKCGKLSFAHDKKQCSPIAFVKEHNSMFVKDHNSNLQTQPTQNCGPCKGSRGCGGGKNIHKGPCGRSSDAGYSSDSCENCSNPSSNSSDIACSDCVCTDHIEAVYNECTSCMVDECVECQKVAVPSAKTVKHHSPPIKPPYLDGYNTKGSPPRTVAALTNGQPQKTDALTNGQPPRSEAVPLPHSMKGSPPNNGSPLTHSTKCSPPCDRGTKRSSGSGGSTKGSPPRSDCVPLPHSITTVPESESHCTTPPYRMTYSLQDMLEETCPSDQEDDVISEEDIRRFKAKQNVTDQRQQLRETLRMRFQKLQLRVCERCKRNVAEQHTCV